jgi:glucosylceramidase
MNSCDFSLGKYAHVETPDDIDLKSFNIDRDRQALFPFIKAAQLVAKASIKLLASPWSPPAWMKSNGQMNLGGHLLPQYRRMPGGGGRIWILGIWVSAMHTILSMT